MIKAKDLSRNYGDYLAVDSVNFEIQAGEIVGLLGHNGAGKTTIMKMLTGFLEPSKGKVIIDEVDLSDDILGCQAKIGYLPENSPLYPELSVTEYLEYVANLKNINSENRFSKIKVALEKVDLLDRATDLICTLSKGYQQRVGVAQAILDQPEILILDEPTNGLDPNQIHEMRNLIKELGKHSTVIISTHVLQEVEAVCERVLIMQSGKIAVDSKLTDLKNSGVINITVDQNSNKANSVISQLEGVKAVDYSGQLESGLHKYRAQLESKDVNLVPSFVDELVKKGFKLYQIGFEERTLDSIFRELESNRVKN